MAVNVRDAIERALHCAIEDRLSFLDAMDGCDDVEVKAETNEYITAWRKILKRRYGDDRLMLDRALEGTVKVDIRDIKPNAKMGTP